MYKSKIDTPIERIRKKVSDYQLFKYYAGDFTLGKSILSPLRKEKHPSFLIYANGQGLKFKDFGSGQKGSIFDFVMLKYGCSFCKAIDIINKDFKNNCKSTEEVIGGILIPPIKHLETLIEIKKRKWCQSMDYKFWACYGLNKEILEKFNVFPISHAWINGKLINYSDKNIHYAYRFGNKIYKIYSPYSKRKWIGNVKSHILQGYDQLPENGDLLIITKSLKDVLTLYTLGFSSIAPQSETNHISGDIVEGLKKRFKKLLVLYDNDRIGVESAEKILNEFNIPNIKLKDEKDISDLHKKIGREETLKTINELITFKGLINYIKWQKEQ